MKTVLIAIPLIIAAALLSLTVWRQTDHCFDRTEMDRLIAFQPSDPGRFTAEMVANLPDPACRYFAFTIIEGTLLLKVAEIK